MMRDSAKQNAFTAQQFIRALGYVEARKEVLHLIGTPAAEAAERELNRLTIFIEQDTTDQTRIAIHRKEGR